MGDQPAVRFIKIIYIYLRIFLKQLNLSVYLLKNLLKKYENTKNTHILICIEVL